MLRASGPMQVINAATRKLLGLDFKFVTVSYASYICFHCFQFSDKFPPICSLGGKGTLEINDDGAPLSSGEALGPGVFVSGLVVITSMETFAVDTATKARQVSLYLFAHLRHGFFTLTPCKVRRK